MVFLDALSVKMREGGQVSNRAVYVALGVNVEGEKDVLGLWVADAEGSKFWLQVLTEMRNRGVEDVLFFCVDGLKGFDEAIEAAYPQATVQLCIVHLVRASLRYVGWKERKRVAAALKRICGAATEAAAEQEFSAFEAEWGGAYPPIGRMWRRDWERIRPLFGFAGEVRRTLYTTNAVEALHRGLRKATKTRGAFPSEEAALKLLYLVIRNVSKKWKSVVGWRAALNHFAILWPERMALAEDR